MPRRPPDGFADVHVLVPTTIHEWLRAHAADSQTHMSSLIRSLILRYRASVLDSDAPTGQRTIPSSFTS